MKRDRRGGTCYNIMTREQKRRTGVKTTIICCRWKKSNRRRDDWTGGIWRARRRPVTRGTQRTVTVTAVYLYSIAVRRESGQDARAREGAKRDFAPCESGSPPPPQRGKNVVVPILYTVIVLQVSSSSAEPDPARNFHIEKIHSTLFFSPSHSTYINIISSVLIDV